MIESGSVKDVVWYFPSFVQKDQSQIMPISKFRFIFGLQQNHFTDIHLKSCRGTVLENCCASVLGFTWELLSDLGVVSPLQSTNCHRKSMNLTETFCVCVFFFLFSFLDLPTPELKCHLMPFAVSLCFHYSANNILVVCQPTSIIPSFKSLHLWWKKGKPIHWLQCWRCFILARTQIYVLCSPVCSVLLSVALLVKGNYSSNVCVRHAHVTVKAPCVFVSVCVCVLVGK